MVYLNDVCKCFLDIRAQVTNLESAEDDLLAASTEIPNGEEWPELSLWNVALAGVGCLLVFGCLFLW